MFLKETYFVSICFFRLNSIFDVSHAARHDLQWKADFLNNLYRECIRTAYKISQQHLSFCP